MPSSDKRSNEPREHAPGAPHPEARVTRVRNGYQWLALSFAVGVVWQGVSSVPAQATTFEKRVTHDDDDAEEDDGGGVSLNNSKLEMGQQRWTGVRFLGVTVP